MDRRRLLLLFPLLWVLLLFLCDTPVRACAMLLSTLLHEGAHLLVLRMMGCPAPTLGGQQFGFLLHAPGLLSYRQELLAAAAGPTANLLLAALLALLYRSTPCEWLMTLLAAQLVTSLCNLLPIAHTDGGRIMGVLFALLLPDRVAWLCRRALSFVCICCLLFLSLFFVWKTGLGAYPLLFSFYFLFAHAAGAEPPCEKQEIAEKQRKREVLR